MHQHNGLSYHELHQLLASRQHPQTTQSLLQDLGYHRNVGGILNVGGNGLSENAYFSMRTVPLAPQPSFGQCATSSTQRQDKLPVPDCIT